MSADHFVKVFDVLDAGYRDWTFPAFGLIFVAVGTVIAVFPMIARMAGIPFLSFQSRWRAFSRYGMVVLAILWTAVVFLATYSAHLRHKWLVEENRCSVVAGPVEHFVPMPSAGHAQETFTVAGVPFGYSDFGVTDAFNNTRAYGGPINANSYVRICYDPSDNAILRLEIRDFTGKLKDYSTAASFFPQLPPAPDVGRNNPPHDVPRNNPPATIEWFGTLAFVLLIADFAAIQVLFLPYLRTFFRLKTMPVRDSPIPATLEAGKKIKLRNCTILWDRETRVIWLRPRGLNVLQVPFAVAALSMDAGDRWISAARIRFSPAPPLFFALLLAQVYWSTSATMRPGVTFPSPAVVVGIFVLLFLIGAPIGLLRLRSRMEILVRDALAELKDMSGPWSRRAPALA